MRNAKTEGIPGPDTMTLSYYDHNVCNNGLLMLRFGPVIALHLLTSILKRGRKCLQKRLVGLFTEVMRYYLIERRTT